MKKLVLPKIFRHTYLEKAVSVKLVKGKLTENPGKVETAFCYACRKPFEPKLVAVGLGHYKHTQLYSCKGCTQIMIKINLNEQQ